MEKSNISVISLKIHRRRFWLSFIMGKTKQFEIYNTEQIPMEI